MSGGQIISYLDHQT